MSRGITANKFLGMATFGHLERNVAAMTYDLRADLDEFPLESLARDPLARDRAVGKRGQRRAACPAPRRSRSRRSTAGRSGRHTNAPVRPSCHGSARISLAAWIRRCHSAKRTERKPPRRWRRSSSPNAIGYARKPSVSSERFIIGEYGATLDGFPARMMAILDERGDILCAAGLRSRDDGFFSERYLDSPIEAALGRLRGEVVRRDRVFEISTFASRSPHSVPCFIGRVIEYGEDAGFEWGFFTLTNRLSLLLIGSASSLLRWVRQLARA